MYDKTTVINMFTLTLPALGNSLCYDIKTPFFRCVFFFYPYTSAFCVCTGWILRRMIFVLF